MSKPLFVKPKALTRPDQLREQLTQLEALLGQLGHGLGEEALAIPALFDQITTELAGQQAAGQSAPAETGRLESASAELRRKAAIYLREVGGARAARDARSAHQPSPEHWWWFPDQMIADKRRAQLRQWVIRGGIVVLLVVPLAFVYQRFLAPDPATMASYRHQQSAESLAQSEDWAGALAEVDQALASLPNDPGNLVLKGILEQKLGQDREAEETFAAAEARLGSKKELLLLRAEQLLNLGQNQDALADAQDVITLQEDSAMGYLVLGQANMNLGNYGAAIEAFQQAGELADSQGNSQIAAAARVQLGMAMQLFSSAVTPTP